MAAAAAWAGRQRSAVATANKQWRSSTEYRTQAAADLSTRSFWGRKTSRLPERRRQTPRDGEDARSLARRGSGGVSDSGAPLLPEPDAMQGKTCQ
ncbi:hypothetical protein EYF80_052510 [Liparis tanakae]|uniref:Uncharacterized protein n=1 Tax=Liparis tanakae TaxID=230148 RepID=A0A4Z2F847_9TELE|nr:hypothetical protein EYF80_052510 [Liparis tanakae]